jgi:uncharacterized protein YdaU (DUF1376 family)
MEIDLHYYQFNIGDYRKDTVHLSRIEHSIYRDLIDWYYLDEKPIPKETQSVSRRLRLVSQEEQNALLAVLEDFFICSEEGWRHKRIDQEIQDYHGMCETNRTNGRKGGRPKKNPLGFDSEPTRNPNQEPITTNQEPITIVKDEEPKGSLSGSIPTMHKEVVDLFHKILPELPEVRIWNNTRQSLLKSRWRETAVRLQWKDGNDGLEYFEKLFNWIRQSPFLMGKVNPKPGQRAFECELEWILRPQNWAKLIEGKYHAV